MIVVLFVKFMSHVVFHEPDLIELTSPEKTEQWYGNQANTLYQKSQCDQGFFIFLTAWWLITRER